MDKIRVYLSGGFYGGWQKKVIEECGTEHFYFLNPLEKNSDKKGEWRNANLSEEEKEEKDKVLKQSPWWFQDKLAVEKADIIFCYGRDYRPKMIGPGYIFELGMAFALGKIVIYINEIEHRYYREYERIFISFKTLDEGIEYLKNCSWLK
jgi:nucleoside 2-deoxyribosyltransferase